MKTGVIIPCYNEEKRLDVSTIVNFIQSNNTFHLCFVDQGSSDNTLQVLREIKELSDMNHVSIVQLKKNKGKAEAIRVGVRHFFNNEDIGYIGYIDVHMPMYFNKFLKLFSKFKDEEDLTHISEFNKKLNCNPVKNVLKKISSDNIKIKPFLILGLPIKQVKQGEEIFKRDVIPAIHNYLIAS